jgi:Golgi nucleoside diphosphatase
LSVKVIFNPLLNVSGISSFVNDPKKAGSTLEGLLKNATNNVPHDKKSSTPVYLGATAGMRLLQ